MMKRASILSTVITTDIFTTVNSTNLTVGGYKSQKYTKHIIILHKTYIIYSTIAKYNTK